MSNSPSAATISTPRRDDIAADRKTFIWVLAFMAAALIIDILSDVTERCPSGCSDDLSKFIIYETTGYFFILALFPIIGWVASRWTPGQHSWRVVIPVHFAASIVVSLLHVGAMVATRKLIFLALFGHSYIFTSDLTESLIYEYRKDILTYSLFLFFIVFGRQLAQQARELAAARSDARESKRVTFKSGGRSIWIDAGEISHVRSAANYVEITANGKTHLARSTLGAIEQQLDDAGAKAARVHRSYVINLDRILEIRPTGEGDVKIEMRDGAIIPGSRRYRDRLPATN